MSDNRSPEAAEYRKKLYWTPRWRHGRARFLQQHPLCQMCEKQDRVVAATVVDHIKPHRGDETLFWNEQNWAALCADCHNRVKARMERGLVQTLDATGWPV